MNAPTSLLHPLKAQVMSFQEEEHDYHFQVEYPDPPACHTCGTVGQLVRFGKKQVKYRDVPMHGKRVSLWAVQRRFQCKSCESTFTPKFHEMSEDHRMTKRCYDYIVKRSLSSTNAGVAQDVGVDESVVRAVIKAYCDIKAYSYRPTLPRILGIDELYLNRQFRCVLTDIERGTIIDILESRQFDVLYNYLANMRGRDNVQIICQDMWKPYRDVASKLFPRAAVVVDRFHIQRMANEAMETLRKGLKKELT
ncbi:transposase, partial [Pseudomonas aeruginosa]|nr:transposase [Pseudomonas aeruginosa]